jgi:hypothetical protein
MSVSLVDLVIGGLATWRLSHLLLYEAGPFAVFRRLRERLGVEYDEFGHVVSFRWEITTCIWCLSVWVGSGIALLIYLLPTLSVWMLLPYALSAFAALLSRISTGNNK